MDRMRQWIENINITIPDYTQNPVLTVIRKKKCQSELDISNTSVYIPEYISFINHLLGIVRHEVYAIISLSQPFHNVRLKFFIEVKCKSRMKKTKCVQFFCLTYLGIQVPT